MRVFLNYKRFVGAGVLSLSLLLLSLTGCGSGSSNNDQGVAFTLLGFFSDFEETAGQVGDTITLSGTDEFSNSSPNEDSQTETAVPVILGLQNNLSGQFIRADIAYITYFVNGASAQPPSTSVSFSVFLGPASEGNSSLPPTIANPNTSFAQIPIVPADIRAWLALNRNDLPEPPFTMTATVYVSGVTSSGDRLDTNQATYFLNVVPDVPIAPTGGGSDTAGLESEESDSEFVE